MSALKFLSAHDLCAKGITFSRQHRHRLIRDGKFPVPVKIGDATNGFFEAEIDDWIAAKIAERDARIAAKALLLPFSPGCL
jgi:prophage regulatory protein